MTIHSVSTNTLETPVHDPLKSPLAILGTSQNSTKKIKRNSNIFLYRLERKHELNLVKQQQDTQHAVIHDKKLERQ